MNPLLPQQPSLRHSPLGIASSAIAIVMSGLEFVLVIAAGILEASTPGGLDESSPIAVVLGLLIIGGLVAAMLGVGLGVAGLFHGNKSKLFPVLGIVLGVTLLSAMGLLLLIGSLMG